MRPPDFFGGTMIRLIVAAVVLSIVPAFAETPLERGSYLVNAVMACDGCHTPRGPGGFVMEKRFSGGSILFNEPAFTVKGANITADRDTGIGSWTADDVKRALTEGVRPNGIPLAPAMPFAFYKILTPGDLDAIVAYTRSIAAVRNEVQPPVYKAVKQVEPMPGAAKPLTQADLNDKLKRGFYLATIAHCMECHARRPDGTQDYVNWNGKGGYIFKGPFGEVAARNISS